MGILNRFFSLKDGSQAPEPKFKIGDEVEADLDGEEFVGTVGRLIQFHPDRKEWLYGVGPGDGTSIGLFESVLRPSTRSLAPSTEDLEQWMTD